MTLTLLFGVLLAFATLVSQRAQKTVLSLSALFLFGGMIAGGALQRVHVDASTPLVAESARVALFAVLFLDAMRLPFRDLAASWKLPGRTLLVGLPLTLLGIAALAWWIFDLTLLESLLIAAVLTPTDPVLASALLSHERVPQRVKRTLGIESGLNDGLALPIVLILLERLRREPVHPLRLLLEVLTGLAIGVAVPFLYSRLARQSFFQVSDEYRTLAVFAVGLVLYGLRSLVPYNEFLAAFSAGVTIASLRPEVAEEFTVFGAALAELVKLLALLIFGALITPHLLLSAGWRGLLFAILVLGLTRPIALLPALKGAELNRREWLAVAWFGPKGFASVIYGLLALSQLEAGSRLFPWIAMVVVLSILLHSSTDIIVARRFEERASGPREPGPASRHPP